MTSPTIVGFDVDDPDPAIASLGVLLARTDGRGWVNLKPLPVVDPPERTALAAWVSARGPVVPLATVAPGRRSASGAEPIQLGLEHGAGPKALVQLEEAGVHRPGVARRLQDNARRGIVLAVSPETQPADIVRWILDATAVLTQVALTGNWLAESHGPAA